MDLSLQTQSHLLEVSWNEPNQQTASENAEALALEKGGINV